MAKIVGGRSVGQIPTQTKSLRPNEARRTRIHSPYIIDMMTGYWFGMGIPLGRLLQVLSQAGPTGAEIIEK